MSLQQLSVMEPLFGLALVRKAIQGERSGSVNSGSECIQIFGLRMALADSIASRTMAISRPLCISSTLTACNPARFPRERQ
jgi:hypothetical protein